jgi:hypothetical protein
MDQRRKCPAPVLGRRLAASLYDHAVASARQRRLERAQAPVSSGRSGGAQGKALPPLSSFDRRPDGRYLGSCPRCGGQKWWDNRAHRAAGQSAEGEPDFRCAGCRLPMNADDPELPPGLTVNPPIIDRRTKVDRPPPRREAGRTRPGTEWRQCVATKAGGEQCRNNAMAGFDRCGRHLEMPSLDAGRCSGVTKKGVPCRAAAQRGSRFCPADAGQAAGVP